MEEPKVKVEETVKQEQTVVGGQTAPKDQVITSQKTVKDEYVKSPRAYMIIWYIVGLFEILIAIRFILLLTGAAADS
jgi:predicted nucleic acid-binding Zn ribbon protein